MSTFDPSGAFVLGYLLLPYCKLVYVCSTLLLEVSLLKSKLTAVQSTMLLFNSFCLGLAISIRRHIVVSEPAQAWDWFAWLHNPKRSSISFRTL